MTYILPLLWITSCKPKYGTTPLNEVRPYRLKKTKSPLIATLCVINDRVQDGISNSLRQTALKRILGDLAIAAIVSPSS